MLSIFKSKCINSSKIIVLTCMVLTQAGCSAYKNKFECGPAGGTHCSSVEDIHAMLENGEIWRHNGAVKRCKGKKCETIREEDRIASNDRIIKVWIPNNYRQNEYRDGQYWYIPAQSNNLKIN